MARTQDPVRIHGDLCGSINLLSRCFWKIALVSLVLPIAVLQGQTVGTMNELVENVRTNEELYANLEVRLRSTYRLGEPENPSINYTKSGERSARFVYQDGMIYFRNDEENKDLKGIPERSDVLEGFDGKTTRLLEQNVIANIREGKIEHPCLFRPHSLILQGGGVRFPLSTFLRGGKELRAHPPYNNVTTSIRLEGDEVVDGLRCCKLRLSHHLDSWKTGAEDVRYLWLARERNYLPVRTEYFANPVRAGFQADEVGTSTNFREISPGVWFPFHSTLIVYTGTSTAAGQPLVAFNTTEFTIDQANLDPHYDMSLFQDIPFPDGLKVQVVKDGKIAQEFIQGGKRIGAAKLAEAKSSNLTGIVMIMTFVAIFIGVVSYAVVRRRRRVHAGLAA